MKNRHLIFTVVGLIIIIITYLFISEEELIIFLTLSQTIFAFTTLMIAIVLFDRYQAGSKLNDKTINLIIEYVEFLRKQTIMLENYKFENKGIYKNGFQIINFSSTCAVNKNEKIYINFKSYFFFYRDFYKYFNSPWIPQKIKEASLFLTPKKDYKRYSLDTIKEDCTILNFCGNDVDYEDLVIFDDFENIDELCKKINNLMKTLNLWIKEQADDINFHV